MDASAKNELESIKRELKSIIAELQSISNGVRRDFVGIGNEQCAKCIENVLGQYRIVQKQLNNIDTTQATESYAKSHNTGGGSGGGDFR